MNKWKLYILRQYNTNGSSGYTLLEVILAIVILAFIMIGFSQVMYFTCHMNLSSEMRYLSVDIAGKIIELIQGIGTNLENKIGRNTLDAFPLIKGYLKVENISRFKLIELVINKYENDSTIFENLYQVDIKLIWSEKGKNKTTNITTLIYKGST